MTRIDLLQKMGIVRQFCEMFGIVNPGNDGQNGKDECEGVEFWEANSIFGFIQNLIGVIVGFDNGLVFLSRLCEKDEANGDVNDEEGDFNESGEGD
jgi:hypothetical protein